MNGINIGLLDGRLRKRYAALVKQQMRAATSVSTGLASFPGEGRAAACAQALWRFLANGSVTLPVLAKPPRDLARQIVNHPDYGSRYVLLVHDWSKLTYTEHTFKPDQVEVSHGDDLGYERTASLLIDAERGSPLAPMELQLWAADGVHTTRHEGVAERVGHARVVVLLALADRKLFQTAQTGGTATGTLAAGIGGRDRETPVGGEHVVRAGLATGTRHHARRREMQSVTDAAQRPPNKTAPPRDGQRVTGRPGALVRRA